MLRHVVLADPAILAEVERRGKTAEMMDVMSAAYAVGADTDLAVGRYLAGLGIFEGLGLAGWAAKRLGNGELPEKVRVTIEEVEA